VRGGQRIGADGVRDENDGGRDDRQPWPGHVPAGFRGAREFRARKNRRQGRETDENRTDARVRRTRARDCCARRRVGRRFTVFSIHLFIYVSVLFSARTRRGSVT